MGDILKDGITLLGQNYLGGEMPTIQMRIHLSSAQQTAHGWTQADRRARADGADDIAPSEVGDGFALRQVYAAVVGECWHPDERDWPTMAECRHDVLKYGQGVADAFCKRSGDARVLVQLVNEGRRLMALAAADMGSLFAEVKEEVDFTEAPEAGSGSATG